MSYIRSTHNLIIFVLFVTVQARFAQRWEERSRVELQRLDIVFINCYGICLAPKASYMFYKPRVELTPFCTVCESASDGGHSAERNSKCKK